MKKHYYWLDLIRFMAAFMVLLSHLRASAFVEFGMLPDSQKNMFVMLFYGILRMGHEAVLVFFVMSGFLVGGKSLERMQKSTFIVSEYALDRIIRIFPPLLGTLILIVISNSIMGINNNFSVIFGNLFSLQGIFVQPAVDPLWSLSYEVWFYILFGAVCSFFAKITLKKNLSLFIVITSLLVFVKLDYTYLFLWLIGTITYFYHPKSRSVYFQLFYLGLTLLFLILLQLTSDSRSINIELISSFFNKKVLEILFSISFSLFMIINILPQNKILLFLEKSGSTLALFSYSLYLSHFVFIHLLQYAGFPKSTSMNLFSIFLFICQIIICLLGSYIMYLLFEKHSSLLKNLLKKNILFRTK